MSQLQPSGATVEGLTAPRRLRFARRPERIVIAFNDPGFAMLHETLIFWAALGTPPGGQLHAGIAVLPSSSRIAEVVVPPFAA